VQGLADPELAIPRPLHRIAGRRIVDLDAMAPGDRLALGHRLYRIHCQIFAGVSEDNFHANVIVPPADRNLVQLYLDSDGEMAGYCAVHRFRRRLRGREISVIRAEAGLRPEFRGRGATYWFGITYALRLKLRHPLTPVYYLGTLVHASSYHLFCKYFPWVYPAPGRPRPDDMRVLALSLIDSFDRPAVDPADPLVRDVGWITLETPQESALNRQTDLPDVQYYLRRNPGYVNGHGLVVLVPLSLPNILGAVAARLWECLRHRIGRRPPRL
jgi:hypothetical protein